MLAFVPHSGDSSQRSLVSSKPLLESTTSIFILWCFLGIAFHKLIKFVLGRKFRNPLVGVARYHFRCLQENLFNSHVCPKRKARFYKCARRCAKARKTCGGDDKRPCPIECAMMKLAKIHLPPPLPWRKRKSKGTSRYAKQSGQESEMFVQETVPEVLDATETSSVDGSSETSEVMIREVPSQVVNKVIQATPQRMQTPLIDLARMQSWNLLVEQVNRKEAKYRDIDGLYPLHWACSGGPPTKVVQSLLSVYPSAAKKIDNEGSTALHFASHYCASPDVVGLLVQSNPRATRVLDRYGRSPLFHTVEKSASIEVMKILLKQDPSMATVPCLTREERGEPLSRRAATRTPLFLCWAAALSDRNVRSGKTKGKKWEKAQLLLEAAFVHATNVAPEIPREGLLLSASIAMDMYLPQQVVPLVLSKDPKAASMPDQHGRLALSQVASVKQYSEKRSSDLIDLLLDVDQDAINSRDLNGFLPVHLALRAGKLWTAGVSHLFEAFPDALSWDGSSEILPPALIAATREAEEEASAVAPIGDSPVLKRDPYGLLTPKQRDFLRKQEECTETTEDSSSGSVETSRLTTILELLSSDPSVIESLRRSG